MIPFDDEFSPDRRRGLLLADPGRGARRRAGLGGGELPLRRQGAGATRRCSPRARVRDPRRAAGGGGWRDRLLDAGSARWSPRARSRRHAVPGRALPARGHRRRGRRAGAQARLPDRQHRARRRSGRAPGHGVYAAFANGRPAAVNVGVRPTFETGRGLLVEAYLIDFEGDLYGQTLRIAFIERLRGERRFPGVEELIAQMHRDVEAARELCARASLPLAPDDR